MRSGRGFVLAPVQVRAAADVHRARSRAAHLRPAGVEEARQVLDLRLARRVVDHGLPRRADRGHHRVLRRADGRIVQMNLPAAQAPRAEDVPVPLLDLRAQGPQPLQVQVDGPQANLAPAGICKDRAAEPRQHGPQHEDGRAHLLGERLGHDVLARAVRVHDQVHPLARRAAAQALEQPQHVGNVRKVRAAAQPHRPLYEHARRKQRQHRILGPIGPNLAGKRPSSANGKRLHQNPLLSLAGYVAGRAMVQISPEKISPRRAPSAP